MAKKTQKKVPVILQDNIRWMWQKWDVVEVKPAYANNYLIKRGLAKMADSDSLNKIKQKQEKKEKEYSEKVEKFNKMIEDIKNNWWLIIEKKANEEWHLYDKVFEKDIQKELSNRYWVSIEAKNIKLWEKIEYKWNYQIDLTFEWKKESIYLIIR